MGLLLTCIRASCSLPSEHPALLTRVMGIVPGVIGATAGSASGSLSESGDEAGPNPRAEVEEVLRMALAWLRRADPYSFPAAGSNSEQGAAGRPPAGHKVGYLLSGRHRMCCCTHKAVQDQGQALFCFQSASLHWCHIDCVPMPLMLKIGQGCAHRTGDVMMANNAQLAAAEWDYCIKCDMREWLPAAVPRQYQPDIIMLLPKLLEPADHATAANLLIAHLAEATRLGAAAEALIRLPVLATLGLLTVDAGTAKKLLTAVLNVSCCLCLRFRCWLFTP
jgi:hypothetical protein